MRETVNKRVIWTVRDVLKWTSEYLRTKGCDSPRLDSELLLTHTLGIDRLRLFLDYDRPLSDKERKKYRELVRRRASREPAALITGKKEFWSLQISVNPGVLIPRPETEILVEVVLEQCKTLTGCSVLEIGCGSGAVFCAISSERHDIELYACDISLCAISCASINASVISSVNRVHIFASDLLESVRSGPVFDIIFSNPPYIPSSLIDNLEPEIREFEPCCALDGGVDGLATIRRLISGSRNCLKPKGNLILEIGDQQSEEVERLLKLNDFSEIRTYTDLSGKIRVLKAVL
ncbi:MAG: peptide chain release factor N(5)-glutamine methyltransferase [Desulfomonilaceae bacterium]